MCISAGLSSHKYIQTIQLFFKNEPEYGHCTAGLLQKSISLSDLAFRSSARLITIPHQFREMFIGRNLVVCDNETSLVAADLEVCISGLCGDSHSRADPFGLGRLFLVACSGGHMAQPAGQIDLPTGCRTNRILVYVSSVGRNL